MMTTELQLTLPDTSRVWCFHSARTMNADESARFRLTFDAFMETWAAHGADLYAGYELIYNQFIIVAVDESRVPPSGCSIDKLMHALQVIGNNLGLEIVDAPGVCYRDENGEIRCIDRMDFNALARSGGITPETVVFDETIAELGSLRSGRWELPAVDSWHGKVAGF